MLPSLSKLLLDQWNTLIPQVPRPRSLTYLGISGSVEGGTTTYIGFSDQKSPFFVVKVHREVNASLRIVKEQQILQRLQSCRPTLAKTVPQVYFTGNIGGSWVIVESILDGSPMVIQLSTQGTPDLEEAEKNIKHVASWLSRLSDSTYQDDLFSQRELEKRGNETIEAFEALFQMNSDERAFIQGIKRILPKIASQGGCVQHGDFCRQNVLVSGHKGEQSLAIIDWTDGQLLGFPMHDLFFFTTAYYLQARNRSGMESFLQAFDHTFFQSTDYSSIVKRTILDHGSSKSVGQDAFLSLFAIFLMNQSLFEHHKMSRYGLQGGLPRFTLHLAMANQKNFREALKEQVWIYFFRTLVKKRGNFSLQ